MTVVPDLAAIVGAAHVTETETASVVAPANTAELSEVLRACNADRLSVVPTGSGTKLGWGNAVKTDILLSTARLTGVYEHAWADLTATAGAGTRWGELRDQLAVHGQRVALDPLFAERATVGGVLATNDSGVLRDRYGSLRDLVLGMTVVLADGTVARTGGKVVKNVAGYDLPKLLTGSFGTLGVITEATFRLHPLPLQRVSFTIRWGELLSLAGLLARLPAAHLPLEAVQMRNEPGSFALDLQLAASAEVLAEYEPRLRTLAGPMPVEAAEPVVWLEREALFADPANTVLKITSLRARLPAIVAGFAELAQGAGGGAGPIFSRAVAEPAGVVTVALRAESSMLTTIVADLRDRLAVHGGMVVVLQRGGLAPAVDAWGSSPPAIEAMRAVKAEFDPARTLSPGRFVGEI